MRLIHTWQGRYRAGTAWAGTGLRKFPKMTAAIFHTKIFHFYQIWFPWRPGVRRMAGTEPVRPGPVQGRYGLGPYRAGTAWAGTEPVRRGPVQGRYGLGRNRAGTEWAGTWPVRPGPVKGRYGLGRLRAGTAWASTGPVWRLFPRESGHTVTRAATKPQRPQGTCCSKTKKSLCFCLLTGYLHGLNNHKDLVRTRNCFRWRMSAAPTRSGPKLGRYGLGRYRTGTALAGTGPVQHSAFQRSF